MMQKPFIVLLIIVFASANLLFAAGEAANGSIETAILALQEAPTNSEHFNALAKAAATSQPSDMQARALAICYLGYRLGGQTSRAKNVKALLDRQHPTSGYADRVRDEQLFSQQECAQCEGAGVIETPCPKCSDGDCPNCSGRGTKPGIDSDITCTACRGTGNCRYCKGEGTRTKQCRACRGRGQIFEFKRAETKTLYLELIQQPTATSTPPQPTQPTTTDKNAIILTSAQLARFRDTYNQATALRKHNIYQNFLQQIGSNPSKPTPLLTPFADNQQFVIKDVSIGRDIGKNKRHFYANVSADDGSTYRLMLPEHAEAFANSLKKGATLTSKGWVRELTGIPPRGGNRLYRSVNAFLSM